jgi:glycosyltransferase involved in cell wall biosynthesis
MKILINAASSHMGGAVTQLQNILEWLPKKMPSSQAVVYVPEATMSVLPDGGVDIRAYPHSSTAGKQRLYFDQVEIPRMSRRMNVDLLFSMTGFGTFRSPVPQVLSISNMAYFDPQYQLKYRELGRSFMKKRLRRWHSLLSIWAADAVLFPTQAIRDVVNTYFSLEGTTTHALHFGNDLSGPAEENKREHNIPDKLQQSIRNKGPLLLNVSTYAIQKNLVTLIEALPRLLKKHPSLRLVTTTSREQTSDKEEYDALKERAVELGVDQSWVELGYVPHDELPLVYNAADVYVFPSFTESFGHSLVEAMACGLPVVAADTDVHREVCADAGVYFSTFDPVDCAETVHGVLEDGVRRAEMERMSVQRAGHFSWERYTERLAEVCLKMAGDE